MRSFKRFCATLKQTDPTPSGVVPELVLVGGPNEDSFTYNDPSAKYSTRVMFIGAGSTCHPLRRDRHRHGSHHPRPHRPPPIPAR
jgi:hypothetical protein